jgi:hypothetical protein
MFSHVLLYAFLQTTYMDKAERWKSKLEMCRSHVKKAIYSVTVSNFVPQIYLNKSLPLTDKSHIYRRVQFGVSSLGPEDKSGLSLLELVLSYIENLDIQLLKEWRDITFKGQQEEEEGKDKMNENRSES